MSHIRNGEYPYLGWKRDFPNVTFPAPRDGIDYPEQEIWWVHDAPQPVPGDDYDPETHTIIEGRPEYVGGQWRQTWEAVSIPAKPIPHSCTPAQGLMALYELKTITEDDILAAIDSIENAALRYQALIAYKKATVWERSSVSMQTLAALLGLTEVDLDKLFALAVTYTNL